MSSSSLESPSPDEVLVFKNRSVMQENETCGGGRYGFWSEGDGDGGILFKDESDGENDKKDLRFRSRACRILIPLIASRPCFLALQYAKVA